MGSLSSWLSATLFLLLEVGRVLADENTGSGQQHLVAGSLQISPPCRPGPKEVRSSPGHAYHKPKKRGPRLHMEDEERAEMTMLDAQVLGAARDLITSTGLSRVDHQGKIAFLFLTRGPIPLADLWAKFFKGHERKYAIYIHSSDSCYRYNSSTTTFEGFYDRNVPSVRILWGSLTMITATRRLLAEALLDGEVQRFVLVSESCIPIRTFEYVYNYLFSSYSSYVHSEKTRKRYNMKLMPKIPVADWFKGSQWFAVMRLHAELLVQDEEFYNAFEAAKFFIPDEHYVQVVLENLAPENLVNRPITYRVFEVNDWHPRTFTATNISRATVSKIQIMNLMHYEMIRSKSGEGPLVKDCSNIDGVPQRCYLFARKFDPSSLRSLLNMPDILGY